MLAASEVNVGGGEVFQAFMIAAANDYEINLKAELEIMGLHEKFDQMRTDQLASLLKSQEQQIEMIIKMITSLQSADKS